MIDLNIYFTRMAEDEKDLCVLAARNPALFAYQTLNPARVEICLRVSGLHRMPGGEVVVAREHHAEISRPPTYPLETGPFVRFVTSNVQHVHPNICPATGLVCYGALEPERWAPSLGLDNIVLILARMLRLEIFNLTDVIAGAQANAHYVRRLAEEGRTPLDGCVLKSGDASSETENDAVEIDLDEIEEEGS